MLMAVEMLQEIASRISPSDGHIETFETDIEKLPLQLQLARNMQGITVLCLQYGSRYSSVRDYGLFMLPIGVSTYVDPKREDEGTADDLRRIFLRDIQENREREYSVKVSSVVRVPSVGDLLRNQSNGNSGYQYIFSLTYDNQSKQIDWNFNSQATAALHQISPESIEGKFYRQSLTSPAITLQELEFFAQYTEFAKQHLITALQTSG